MFGIKTSRDKEFEAEITYLEGSLANCEDALEAWMNYAESLENEVQELKNEVARLKILNNDLKNEKLSLYQPEGQGGIITLRN